MRERSLAMAPVLAGLLFLSACGGGTSHSPAAPSTGISIAQVGGTVGTGIGATSVTWSCFSRLGGSTGGMFGVSGCPAVPVTLRSLTGAAPLVAPSAPSGLSATVTGSSVTLNWTAPVGGDPPSSYIIQAGSATGLSDVASFDTGGTATSLAVLNVPAGTYYVRVRANNSGGASGPSNEFLVVVAGAAPCGSLSAPTGVVASVTGGTVVLSWVAPAGCAPTNYIIQVGSAPGLSNLASFSTGSVATNFTATGVGAGTYYLRLLSAAGGAVSAPSTEVAFVVGGCGSSPGAPANLRATVTGSTIVLMWDAPGGACPATSYLLQAGSSSGLSNLANSPVTGTSLSAFGVGNGTYYIRVIAVNAIGQSAASNEIVVSVGPVAPPTPTPTPSLTASFQLVDPGTSSAPTTVCQIRSQTSQPSTCLLSSTSVALGANTIVSYEWTVEYTYDTPRRVFQAGSSPTLAITEVCGLTNSTADGAAQPFNVTLKVIDNLGATAKVKSGSSSQQPALQLRLFTCGS